LLLQHLVYYSGHLGCCHLQVAVVLSLLLGLSLFQV
jgi:hypothetical protein